MGKGNISTKYKAYGTKSVTAKPVDNLSVNNLSVYIEYNYSIYIYIH